MVEEAEVEHDSAKVLIRELMHGGQNRDAKLKVLTELVKAHIAEEEATSGLFARAQKAGINIEELGQQLRERKEELEQKAERGTLPPPRFVLLRGFGGNQQKDETMNRNGSGRDEQGRFISDDDRSRNFSRSGSSRFDHDDDRGYRTRGRDDDDRDSRGRSRGGWFGDPEGHSMAARGRPQYRDDDDERHYRARGRDFDDDDRGRTHDRDPGGWYGDSERHAEASRRGWDEREGPSRSRSRDDEDRSFAARGRDYGEDRSFAPRGRDDEDDRDNGGRRRGGWFGDPQRHAEASREGWAEHRGEYRGRRSRDEDDRRYAARGRDYDDDNREGRGRGGWFGDPEGHSQASRRGWDDRR
jgi:hypothetical protein